MDRNRNNRLISIIRTLFVYIFIVLYACTKKEKELEYFDDGNLKAEYFISNRQKDSTKTYYKNGNLKSLFIYDKSKIKVSHFYDNGNIKNKGALINDSIPIGLWKYYNKNGHLEEIREFLLIDNQYFLNQNWVLNSKRDTLKDSSNFFEIILEKDTIYLGEPIKAKVDLVAPYFRNKNSSIMVVLTRDSSIDFNSDFSNLAEVSMDTTFNLNLEKEMRRALGLETDFRRTSIFGKYFNQTGPQKFRGIIVEYYYTFNSIPDSIGNNYYEKKQYFEKDIYVMPNN